jgi:NAD(P)-dependent dehydrogenase (short-subunit alcohol dehydrogenase family)/acyl dehydratase/putative sterol carrier protein
MSKLLDGKVVVVTGAGAGLGRCHALAFAREGAKIVVNDLGGARDGTGASRKAADMVVEEIQKAGGEAVANYDSVATSAGADAIVRTAIEKFGRIDVLVNNAGILRDKTIVKMTDEEFDLVMAVHARGTWACTRAAARAMMEKNQPGRIINTTSAAGLKGNFGQSNYSAGKAAIYGITLTTAMEFRKYGITVNAIAPLAKTRMTEDIDMIEADMRPEDVSPVVVWLASDLAKDVTGRIFGVHGRHVFEYRMDVTDGVKRDAEWTPADITAKLGEISGEAKPAAPTAAAPSAGLIPSFFQLLPQGFDAERAKDWKTVMVWSVTGAGDWTVEVADKKAKVTDGKAANATCTVTVDAASLTSMIEGKLDPQMAFLNGKIKATRIDDLGKFGKVFDFKKMRGLAGSAAPAAAAPTSAGMIPSFFQLLPQAFDVERAKEWKTVMVWSVTGAGDWTVEVADKKAKVADGKAANATCTVTVDAASLTSMIEGKLDPQMAFLNGKIKATRIDDLGKFGKVFDFKKMKALASAAPAPAATKPSSLAAIAQHSAANSTIRRPVGDPKSLIESLAQRFIPEKATGFNGVVQLKIDAVDGWVEIRDGKCSSRIGTHPSPTGTITLDAESFSNMLDGVLDPAKAPVKATHPPSWIKFRQVFRFEPLKGLNRALIGRTYGSPARIVRPEQIALYDETVGDKGSLVFPVVLVKPLFLQVLNDPDFNGDVSRLVHAGQSFVFHQPWAAFDLVNPKAKVLGIDTKASGEILTVGQSLWREGEKVVEMESVIFFRGESKGEKKPEAPAPDRGKPTSSQTIVVAPDQSFRYAKASGDDNPIHVDAEFAKAVGFKGVILHGLCTLALATKALPKNLERLSVRFSKPVYPGDKLTTNVWTNGRNLAYETVNQDGEKVLAEGSAVVRA